MLCSAGCSPSFYRADADRQVLAIVREQQGETVGYAAPISVPTETPAQPTRKSYDPLPTTTLPETIDNVVTTTPPPTTNGQLGPNLDIAPLTEAGGTASTRPSDDVSAIDTVRRLSRQPYVLGPPAEFGTGRRLGLFETIAYAVENSREYQTEMERLYLAALDVTLERHLFEPRPFANVRVGYDGGQQSVNYRSALVVTGEAGVRQQLPLGGEIVASGLVDFVNALNDTTADGENAELALRGSIPLLRGAGFVNLEPLIQSERNVVYAVRAFETYRRNFAVDIASAYFRLLTRQQQVKNRYVRYINAVELTNRTKALFAAGRITSLEVQRAQQDLLAGEDEVNSALQTYENEVDNFKLRIGMPMSETLQIVPVEVNVPVPELDAALAADLGRRFRLDLQTTRDRLEDARRFVAVRENQLLPDLDLTLGSTIGNNANSPARDIDGDTVQYNAGLRLDLPLDRVAERNNFRAALIRLEAARRSVEQQEDAVVADVRQSIRGIRSAITSLELQRQGIEIARKRLESANEFLLSGRTSDSRNVVEAQTSLLTAQDRFDQARANLQVAILSYLRDAGVLRLDPSTGELGQAMSRYTETPASRDEFTFPKQRPPTTQQVRAD
jgi:outer membrane protein TolC